MTGVGRVHPDHIAVPALITEVTRAGVDQRVGLPAIATLVDLAAVAIDTGVNDGRIALGIGDRDQAVSRDAVCQVPGSSTIGRVDGLSRFRAGHCAAVVAGMKFYGPRFNTICLQRLGPRATAIGAAPDRAGYVGVNGFRCREHRVAIAGDADLFHAA